MKKFLQHVWRTITSIFKGLDREIKKLVPIASEIVNNIKNLEDTGIIDVITAIIPGGLDDALNAKLKTILPEILLSLKVIGGTEATLNDVIKKIQASTGAERVIILRGLAGIITEKMADGKFSSEDATAVQTWWYQHQKEIANDEVAAEDKDPVNSDN